MQRLEEDVVAPEAAPKQVSPAGVQIEMANLSPDFIQSSPIHDDEKKGYMKKIYGIVTMQLLITFAMVYKASVSPSFGEFCTHPATLILAGITMLASMLSTFCLSRKVPYNYIALFTFTFSMGFIVSACTAKIDPETVLTAIVVTLAMSISLTAYVWLAGAEGAMFALLVMVFIAFVAEFLILALIFTRSAWLYSLYCSLIALMYGCYLVLHTFVIQAESDVDDYIIAAVIIYMDIIRIFLYVLAAMTKNR